MVHRTVCFIGIPLLLIALVVPVTAASGWVQTDTEYFTFIYEPSDAAVVTELAGIADGVYRQVSTYLGVEPGSRVAAGRKIPVVIRGETGDANGYFTFLPQRIVLFTAVPSTPILAPNLDEWLRLVFTHELTHYLQLTEPVGPGRLSALFGPGAGIGNLVLMPRPMAEGLAVHDETRFTDGGRGRNPVFEMQYVAPLLADEFWSFDQNYYGSDFAPRSRVYVGGFVIVDYIIRTYGIDRFMELSREYVRHPIRGIRGAMRRVLDVDADALYAAMLDDLDRAYGDRSDLPSGVRVNPEGPGYWFLVRGGTDVYGSAPATYSGLVRHDAWADGIGRDDRRETLPAGIDPFSLSTHDDVIIGIRPFADSVRPDRWTGFTDLVAVDRRTGTVRRVTKGRRLYHSALLPDGTAAIAVEREGGYSRLVEIDLATGDVAEIWDPPQTYMAAPSVSPDGRQVVLVVSCGGEQDLYLIDIASGHARPLISSVGIPEFFPVFVSNSTVWFTANPDGPLALYALDTASGAVTHLLTDRDGVFYATPLGTGAVYGSYSATGPTVKRADSLDRQPVDWPGGVARAPRSGVPQAAERPSEQVPAHVASRRFVDWPIPALWLPLVLPGRSATGFAVQPGALLVAGSPLEQNLGIATVTMNLSSGTPMATLQYLHSTAPWQTTFDLSSAPEYLDESGLRARLQSSASVTVSREIARWGVYRFTHALTGTVFGSVAALSAEGSVYPDFFAGSSEYRLDSSATVGYGASRETRAADLFGPAGVSAEVTGVVTADASAVPIGSAVYGAVGELALRVPLGPAVADLRAAGETRSVDAGIDDPRGIVVPVVGAPGGSSDAAFVARLGLDSPAFLLDIGFRGLGLTRLGVSGYVQQAVDYAADGIAVRGETSVAIEGVAALTYFSAPFMPSVGLVATIPHADPSAVRLGLTFRNAAAGPGIVIGERAESR